MPAQAVEQSRYVPAEPGEGIDNQRLLPMEVVPREPQQRRDEHDLRSGPRRVSPVGGDARHPAGHVVLLPGAVDAKVVGHVPAGQVVVHVPHVLLLWAEGEAADTGVQSVGADHHVEGAPRTRPSTLGYNESSTEWIC